MNDLTALFCSVDDFWKDFEAHWNKSLLGSSKPVTGPHPELSTSEMMTIVILFHQSNFRTFKHFYFFVCQHLSKEFPKLISYNRFVHNECSPQQAAGYLVSSTLGLRGIFDCRI